MDGRATVHGAVVPEPREWRRRCWPSARHRCARPVHRCTSAYAPRATTTPVGRHSRPRTRPRQRSTSWAGRWRLWQHAPSPPPHSPTPTSRAGPARPTRRGRIANGLPALRRGLMRHWRRKQGREGLHRPEPTRSPTASGSAPSLDTRASRPSSNGAFSVPPVEHRRSG
jgi:hypothetical protein